MKRQLLDCNLLQFLKSTSLLLLRFWLEAVWTWLQTVDLWVIVTTVLRALLVASDLQALLSNRESMGCCACLSSRTQITGVHPSLMHCCFSPISFSALLEYKTKITVRKKAMQSECKWRWWLYLEKLAQNWKPWQILEERQLCETHVESNLIEEMTFWTG